ncbi:hypothetical protein PanWU01x14_313100 [Parasponia andersonii]|uniref:Uncharacterized protein n=1 Tax=Parasponia andersonii TaxID=3476 RepID=A0A2P5AP74_PARAD|nr:hypothetical protein PanWU01x14_313100 [Parasponia andersonii]
MTVILGGLQYFHLVGYHWSRFQALGVCKGRFPNMFKDGGVTLAVDPRNLNVKNLDHTMVWVTNDKGDIGLSGFYYEIEVDESIRVRAPLGHERVDCDVPTWTHYYEFTFKEALYFPFPQLIRKLIYTSKCLSLSSLFQEKDFKNFGVLIKLKELEGPTLWRESVWSVHSVSRRYATTATEDFPSAQVYWEEYRDLGLILPIFFHELTSRESAMSMPSSHSEALRHWTNKLKSACVTQSFPSDASLQSNSSLFLGPVEKLILPNDDAHLKHIGLPRTLKSGVVCTLKLYMQREVTALSNRYCQSENEIGLPQYLEGKASSWEPEKAIAEFEDPPKELVAAGVEPSFVSSSLLP